MYNFLLHNRLIKSFALFLNLINFPFQQITIYMSWLIHLIRCGSRFWGSSLLKCRIIADVTSDFLMIIPTKTSYAEAFTVGRITYDNENLYLFVTNHHGIQEP